MSGINPLKFERREPGTPPHGFPGTFVKAPEPTMYNGFRQNGLIKQTAETHATGFQYYVNNTLAQRATLGVSAARLSRSSGAGGLGRIHSVSTQLQSSTLDLSAAVVLMRSLIDCMSERTQTVKYFRRSRV